MHQPTFQTSKARARSECWCCGWKNVPACCMSRKNCWKGSHPCCASTWWPIMAYARSGTAARRTWHTCSAPMASVVCPASASLSTSVMSARSLTTPSCTRSAVLTTPTTAGRRAFSNLSTSASMSACENAAPARTYSCTAVLSKPCSSTTPDDGSTDDGGDDDGGDDGDDGGVLVAVVSCVWGVASSAAAARRSRRTVWDGW